MYNVDQTIRKKPYPFIKQALELLDTKQHNIIVEIGSMRKSCNHSLDEYDYECCNDGHSSIFLARSSSEFHTVDIDMECAKLTRLELKKFNLWERLTETLKSPFFISINCVRCFIKPNSPKLLNSVRPVFSNIICICF